jgi:hypothetical protein
MTLRLPTILLLLGLLSPCARAATGRWTLTTADLTQRPAQWLGLSEQGVQVSQSKGPQTIPWSDFVEIRQTPDHPPATRPAGLFLELANGDRLIGQPNGITGENLKWNTPSLGALTIPLRQIVSLTSDAAPAPQSTPAPAEDQAQLINGDTVKGIVTDITPQTLTMQVNAQPATIPIASLHRLQLAATATPPASSQRALRLTLDDDSVLTLSAAATNGNTLQLTLPDGAERMIDQTDVVALQQLNGPVLWLSSLKPAQAIQTSDFDLHWPAQMNRSVTGAPIRFGSTTYDQGIGVHAYSSLRFNLPSGYRTFRTQYAIDGDGPLADVTVRILLDEKPVYERSGVKAGTLSPILLLPLHNAKTVTLEVDFGQNGAVQDRFNWIQPALLKQPPPPSSRPIAQ